MRNVNFLLERDYVQLCDLLKLAGVADSGGRGKMLVAEGLVTVDGQPESRKTAKIRSGQAVECMGVRIVVVSASGSGTPLPESGPILDPSFEREAPMMDTKNIRIYHNPRCSKSRSACALLAEKGIEAEVVEYLKNPPTREELCKLLAMLGMSPQDLVRKGEDVFKQHYAGRSLSDEEWLDAMIAHPILIERPIVVCGDKAVLGRPPEKVLELL